VIPAQPHIEITLSPLFITRYICSFLSSSLFITLFISSFLYPFILFELSVSFFVQYIFFTYSLVRTGGVAQAVERLHNKLPSDRVEGNQKVG
jgi:hypothetical protein